MRDKPYCKAPWIGLNYESTIGCKPCCEYIGGTIGINPGSFKGTYADYIKSDWLKDFKKMMYKDTMNPGCKICIDQENNTNRLSRRQKYQKYEINEHGNNKVIRFDYRPGNKCNLICRMCHPESSSMREEEEIQRGNIQSIFRIEDMNDAYDIDLTECETLSILGGEPSIDLEVRKWIDHIKDLDIRVDITTNATNVSDKWFNTLKKLKKLEIRLSIDGTGNANDFQRKGSNWKEIKSNILKYKKEFQNISISLTASAINFTVLDIWWEELMEFNIPINMGLVEFPEEYNLRAIPDKYKEYQIEWLQKWIENPDTFGYNRRQQHEALEAIKILQENTYREDYHQIFKREVKKMDKWRNENISDLDYRFEEILNA
tara:strand:- start:1494 stop:2615 length:1122 start_codon:yes stop_codon:yes gene_type:complete